jgi:hypothetical protein
VYAHINNKTKIKKKKKGQHRVYLGGIEALWKGVCSQSQNSTAVYRLREDIGEGSGRAVYLGGRFFSQLLGKGRADGCSARSDPWAR